MRVSHFSLLLNLCVSFHNPEAAVLGTNATVFRSYGTVFPPLDPHTVPSLDPKTATVLTLCELWENDSIPVTPGIIQQHCKLSPFTVLM